MIGRVVVVGLALAVGTAQAQPVFVPDAPAPTAKPERPPPRPAPIVVTAPPASPPPAPRCPTGQAITLDTDGHCCWPGQVWSHSRAICVGIPECPPGFAVDGEECLAPSSCPPGQRATAD